MASIVSTSLMVRLMISTCMFITGRSSRSQVHRYHVPKPSACTSFTFVQVNFLCFKFNVTSAGIIPGIPGILAVDVGSVVLVGFGVFVIFVGFGLAGIIVTGWDVLVEEGEMIVMHRLLIMHIEQVMMITIRMVERSDRFFLVLFFEFCGNWVLFGLLVSWFSRSIPTGISNQMP